MTGKSPPTFLFAATGLRKGSGGIAELSRQVLQTLLAMHGASEIRLQVHVLDEAGPEGEDELFAADGLPPLRWYGGRRWQFAMGVALAGADVQLFDHVGLARLQGMNPLRRGRYLLLIHSVEMWKTERSDYARTAAGAGLLIANSEYTARKTRARYPALPPIRVCWPGKGEGAAARAGKAMNGLGPHAMLIVGRLDAAQRHKGHDHLLEALPLILKAVPDARLVIAGGGDDAARLQAKAAACGVADRVVFTGWLDAGQLEQLYRDCALFVMPSEGDGFGIVFLEAMMNRLPCVGLRGSAAAEIFEDGSSGILVDREDRLSMAETLSGLLLDAHRRRQMGEAAHIRYRSTFTGQHYDSRLRAILREALEPPQ